MTTTTAPDLNRSADALIQALETVDNLPELRQGFHNALAFYGAFTDPADPTHHDAMQLLDIYKALDDLAAAVAARKEG